MGAQEVDQLAGVPFLRMLDAWPAAVPVDEDQERSRLQGEVVRTYLLERVLEAR